MTDVYMETPKVPEGEKQYSFKELTIALEQAWEGAWTWDVPSKEDGGDPDSDDAIRAHPGLSKLSEEEFDEVGEAVNYEKEINDPTDDIYREQADDIDRGYHPK